MFEELISEQVKETCLYHQHCPFVVTLDSVSCLGISCESFFFGCCNTSLSWRQYKPFLTFSLLLSQNIPLFHSHSQVVNYQNFNICWTHEGLYLVLFFSCHFSQKQRKVILISCVWSLLFFKKYKKKKKYKRYLKKQWRTISLPSNKVSERSLFLFSLGFFILSIVSDRCPLLVPFLFQSSFFLSWYPFYFSKPCLFNCMLTSRPFSLWFFVIFLDHVSPSFTFLVIYCLFFPKIEVEKRGQNI